MAAASSLLAGVFALAVLNGYAVRFTMGAFALRIDSFALIIGCGAGLLLGALGALHQRSKLYDNRWLFV